MTRGLATLIVGKEVGDDSLKVVIENPKVKEQGDLMERLDEDPEFFSEVGFPELQCLYFGLESESIIMGYIVDEIMGDWVAIQEEDLREAQQKFLETFGVEGDIYLVADTEE